MSDQRFTARTEPWIQAEFTAAALRLAAATQRQQLTAEADKAARSELADAREEWVMWGHAADGTGPVPQRRLPGLAG